MHKLFRPRSAKSSDDREIASYFVDGLGKFNRGKCEKNAGINMVKIFQFLRGTVHTILMHVSMKPHSASNRKTRYALSHSLDQDSRIGVGGETYRVSISASPCHVASLQKVINIAGHTTVNPNGVLLCGRAWISMS